MALLSPNADNLSTNPRVVVIEVPAPTYSIRNGTQERTRRFLVYSANEGEDYVPDESAALASFPIPRGHPHPRDPALKALDFTVTETPEGPHVWEIRVTYRAGAVADGVPPGDVGFVEPNLDTVSEFIDAYRMAKPDNAVSFPGYSNFPDLTIPIGGLPEYDAGGVPVDIFGVPIDEGGNPVSVENVQAALTYSEIIEGPPSSDDYLAIQGKRNLTEFEGADPGRLLYAGSRSDRIDEGKWRVSHTIVWDRYYHMRQRCQFHEDRNGNWVPLIRSDPDSSYHRHASGVFWAQPHPGLVDFHTYLPPVPD